LYRVIACGVEAVNTTAELYKSGSATCYRAPSHREVIQAGIVVGASTGPFFADTFDLPPATQSDAQLYPNSRTWSAAEGYYGIGTLSDSENPFLSAIPKEPWGWKPPSVSQLMSGAAQPVYTYAPSVAGFQAPATCTTARVFPFDTHGCIFSGLNAQSTLQITTRYIIERIPSTSEPDLLVLTRPPSPYDSTALDLYAKAISELPVGCMVKENPLGEWFNDVLQTVADFAAPVGAVFGPLGATLGSGIASGAKTWLASREPQTPQVLGQNKPRKKKVTNPPSSAAGTKKKRRKKSQVERGLAKFS